MQSILIGYGYWGHIVEKYIRNSELFELIGIFDPDIPNSLDLDEMLNHNLVECAFVCTPIETHFSIVQNLLERGVHIFCEKPLCKKKNDTLYLIKLAKEHNLVLFTDYIYTVSPSLRLIKEHISDLGKIFYIDMRIKQFGRFYKEDNVFEVIGIHMISALVYLLDVKEYDIQVLNVEKVKSSSENLIEAGIIFFKVYNINGKIECNLLSNSKERKIEIICEHGVIIFDMLDEITVKFILHLKDGEQKVQSFLIKETYDESNNLNFALESFYQSIIKKDNFNFSITERTAEVLDQVNCMIMER